MEPQKTPPNQPADDKDVNVNPPNQNPDAPIDEPVGDIASQLDPAITSQPEGPAPAADAAVPGVPETTEAPGSPEPPKEETSPVFKPEDPAPAEDVQPEGAAGGGDSFGDAADSSTQSSETMPQDSGFPVSGDVIADPLPVTAPSHRKKGLIVGLVIAAVLLLLSGGAAASYYYVLNKPENVLKQALANSMSLEKAGTAQFSGVFAVEADGSGVPLEATFKGSADGRTGAVDVSGNLDVMVTNVTFDVRTTDSKTLYFRLGGLEGLPELLASSGTEAALYAPIVGVLNDQWIEVNESMLKQADESYQSAVMTDSDIKKVTDAYLKYPFLVVSEVLADAVIAGENCHHYKLKVDPAKLKGFLAALKDAKLDSYKIDQKVLDSYNKSIDQGNLGQYPFEIWISKDGKMIKQASAKFNSEGTEMNLRFTVDSYNKPVKVEKPEGAKSLMEIMGDFLGGGLGTGLTLPMTTESESGISL